MKRFFVGLMLGVFVLGASLISIGSVKAATPCSHCYCGVTVHVSDASTFYNTINNACADTIIELDNDIYLDTPVNVSVLCNIEKNGHKIMQKYVVEHPGYYTSEPVVTYKNVWHEGWTETGYCEVF